jgi:tetratricopeptide (TPR) repeat protein
MAFLSDDFSRLYCDAAIFDPFSAFHPISFRRLLPYSSEESVVDDQQLISAEEAQLAQNSDESRLRVVEEYLRCGLLAEVEATNVKASLDLFDADFFELMGDAYANAGMFRCALRWHREMIRELEARQANSRSDAEGVYASVGYCLYSLGLFAEAISWTKSCIGPGAMADALCQGLIAYEVEAAGGVIQRVERSGIRTRYTVNAPEPADVRQTVARLKEAMKALAPFQDVYIDWLNDETRGSGLEPDVEGYPFRAEFDAGSLVRHKMNLIFATCSYADELVEKGFKLEAKRLLSEVALLERQAGLVWERLEPLNCSPFSRFG